jgi:hypothetical protein
MNYYRGLFITKKMVFIPNIKRGTSEWVSLPRCRWKGPPVLRKETQDLRTFVCLKDIYAENKRLFCEILGVGDVSLRDLTHEAKYFQIGDSLAHVMSIFHAMEKFLEEDETTASRNELGNLNGHSIFPVSKRNDLLADKVSSLKSNAVEWFIADTSPLRTKFEGILPLLDIKIDDLAPMDQLLSELGLKSRFLSKQAKSIPRTQGVVELDQELTDALRSKVDFIIRLIPTKKQHRKRRRELIIQLRKVEVHTAHEVLQEWCVYYKVKWVKGPAGTSNVALAPEGNSLRIYLAAKSGFELGELELVDEISNYCGMMSENPRHSEMCLHIALSQSDPVRISKLFDDKGIPSLESLKFANVEESESSDEEEGKQKGSLAARLLGHRHSSSCSSESGSKKKFRPFGDVSVGEAILGIPVGIAVGLGGLASRRKCFDGEDDEDATRDSPKTSIKPLSKEEYKKDEEPPAYSMQAKEPKSGPNGLQRIQRSVRNRLRELTICDEDVAFEGEFAVSSFIPHLLTLNTHFL